MDIAVSIYWGGQKIHANDPSLNVHSYRLLGLRCAYCGEPVHHRKGEVNRSHFAHFPSITAEILDECLLRQRSGTRSFSPNYGWWNEQNGKGQRFELFQKHFINILKSKFPDLDTGVPYLEPQKTKLDQLQTNTLALARKNKDGFLRYVRVFNNQATSLEREIICEAFDYLISTSSRNIFGIVSGYLIQKSKESKLTMNSDNLCGYILMLLGTISWLETFTEITGSQNIPFKDLDKQFNAGSFLQVVKNTKNLYVYFSKGKLWSGKVEHCCIKNEELLAKLDFSKLIKTQKIVVRKNKKTMLCQYAHTFSDFFIPSDKYDLLVKGNPKIKDSVAKVIRRIRIIVTTKKSHRTTQG